MEWGSVSLTILPGMGSAGLSNPLQDKTSPYVQCDIIGRCRQNADVIQLSFSVPLNAWEAVGFLPPCL